MNYALVLKQDEAPEKDDVYEENGYRIEITDTDTEDGEVVGFTFESNKSIYQVKIKGGGGAQGSDEATETYTFKQGTTSAEEFLYAPQNNQNENRQYYEISNVEFYGCVDEDDGTDDTADGQNGAGPGAAPAVLFGLLGLVGTTLLFRRRD